MTKSITKKAKKPRARKRPKSVLKKAWATRRANAEAAERFGLRRENAELTEMLKEAVTDKAISPVGATSSKVEKARAEQRAESEARSASLAKAMQQTSETETHRSEDSEARAIARRAGIVEGRADLKRETDEAALCGVVAMYRLWNQSTIKQDHTPFMISDIAAKAVVEHLESLGYTPNGKLNDTQKQWRVVTRS